LSLGRSVRVGDDQTVTSVPAAGFNRYYYFKESPVFTPSRVFALLFCLSLLVLAQTTTAPVTVGSGIATVLQTRFQLAFLRGNFSSLVSLPPIANVHAFGTTGLIQEFNDAAKTSGVKAALILPDIAKVGFDGDVLQVYPDLYTYYSAVGVNTAGYPIEDTQPCPGIARCTFQRFANSYALFAVPVGNPKGTQFQVFGPFYTKWTALNSVLGPLGVVTNVETAVTSSIKTTAEFQSFTGGTLFNITSGSNKGQTYAVVGATDSLYESLNGAAGPLGLPVSDEQTLAGNIQRQLFEGGRIQYPTGGTPVILYPVSEVQLSLIGPVTLQSGQIIMVTERAYDSFGSETFGRTVTWSTTNGQVVSIQATGNTAVLKGLGSGYATITATSEGEISTAILVNVSAPCCGVGEGAPSVTIGQTFQDAVTRNKLSVQIPGPNPVRRVSTGYTQDLLSTDGTTPYLIAKADRGGSAFLVSGSLLAAYSQAGGAAGSLGFPISDVSPGGTQLFEGGALAGAPVRVVSAAILSKWAVLKYETGIAGPPTAAAITFNTPSGYTGQMQQFTGGSILGLSTGSVAGQGYFLSGAILARYLALNGPAGPLGLPVSDALAAGAVQRQNFENGYIDFTAGTEAAQEHLIPRTPVVTANPASALAGSRLHLAVSGFPDGSTLRISVAGQPDFTVQTQNGSYAYDFYIDASARSSTVAVHAVDVATSKTADGSYTIKTIADAKPNLTKAAGDNQTGSPGSLLPVPLSVVVTDVGGAPLGGVAVTFSASPGAQVSSTNTLTDSNGAAATSLRLPSVAGLAAVSASSLGKLTIFNARIAGSPSNTSFPTFTQVAGMGSIGNGPDSIADKGGLLTAIAAIVRFYQNQGLVATPNGLADPNTLNQFLKNFCPPATVSGTASCDGFVSNSAFPEQVVNLWRVGAFVGGGLLPTVEDATPGNVRDLVAAGSPVLLSLALQEDGAAAGGAFVVATGIGIDGSLQIFDPNPALGRTAWNDYFQGFSAAGHSWKGTVISALRLLPGQPSATGFVFISAAQPAGILLSLEAQSAEGSCGRPFLIQNAASVAVVPVGIPRISEFLYCDGTQALYEASFTASGPFSASVTDLAPGGSSKDLSAPASTGYQLTRDPVFRATPPLVSFTAAAVVNAASFQPILSPGEIISIFGLGLSGPGSSTTVDVGGVHALLLAASPFQVNAQIPFGLAAGSHTISLRSSYGKSAQQVVIVPEAPGIFVVGNNYDGSAAGAVVNQSGTFNSPATPARRGEILVVYGTGLGEVSTTADLPRTVVPVTAVLSGTELPVLYSGLTTGFIGLYQINVMVPAATPPGLSLLFSIRQAGIDSNTVRIALQ